MVKTCNFGLTTCKTIGATALIRRKQISLQQAKANLQPDSLPGLSEIRDSFCNLEHRSGKESWRHDLRRQTSSSHTCKTDVGFAGKVACRTHWASTGGFSKYKAAGSR